MAEPHDSTPPPEPPTDAVPSAAPAIDGLSPELMPARYELRSEIARGGMGIIVRAFDCALKRSVAVKILHERYRDDARMHQRFFEECRIAGQLQHPGIAPIHDLGTLTDGRPYFTMKLVKGHTLAELLARRTTFDE